MSKGNLSERLRRVRERGVGAKDVKAKSLPPAAGTPGGKHPSLEGFSVHAEGVYERRIAIPLDLPDTLDLSFAFARLRPFTRKGFRLSEPSRSPVKTESLLFFDLETTGLSGGTGTVAFLHCSGRWKDGTLHVRQLFLDDFPYEPEFIDAILGDLQDDDVLVSYNGRSFDEPLLKTRCIMTGSRFPALRHADLLYPARRLYRAHLENCGLGTIEREVLKVERTEDIPSAEIPDEWLNYVRTKVPGRLRETASHNADDIVSLAKLLGSLHVSYRDPLRAGKPSLLFSRSLFSMGRAGEALAVLKKTAESGDTRAAAILARLMRGRNGLIRPEEE